MSTQRAADKLLRSWRAEGEGLPARLAAGALIGAAGLVGFGIILWIAANWDHLGKAGRFSLVGAAVLTSGLIAIALPTARVAASLAGTLAIGGLLALYGQTYQTGADPWQLFALWAGLALPWCLAARHDAVWALWVIVASTALSLWVLAMAGGAWQPQVGVVLPAWLAAGAIAAALSPSLGLERWIGRTPWSFRLAVALALVFVVSLALPSLFSLKGPFLVYLAGVAVVGAAVAAFARRAHFDLALLAAAALAMDVLLVCGVARAVLDGSGGERTIAFLLTGLLAAGIVAASAVGVLSVARRHGSGLAPAAGEAGSERTWPVAVLSGLGALMAAIPLLVFLFLLFGRVLEKGAGTYIIGLLLAVATVPLLRGSKPLGFGQQLGVIGLAVGFLVLGYGLFRDLPVGTASLVLAALCTATAFVLGTAWIAGLLGAGAAALLAVALASGLGGFRHVPDLATFRLTWLAVAVACAGGLLAEAQRAQAADGQRDTVAALIAGATTASLLGLMFAAGPTFLLGGAMGLGGPRLGTATGHAWLWSTTSVLSLLCALAGCALLARRPELRSPVGAAVGLVLLVLSAVSPALGPAVLLAAASVGTGRRVLALLAAFACLWVLGSFYYWLGWTLVHKAYLLIGLGLALAAVAYASGIERPTVSLATPLPALQPALAAGLIALSLLGTGAAVGSGIWQTEEVLRNGRTVYIALAPVDPRSLMQGDYMALRFALPNAGAAAPEVRQVGSRRMQAIAEVDSRDVARIVAMREAGVPPAANQLAIDLVMRNGRWALGPDAYFFKEGTGQRYERARFGAFRVGPSGRAYLVGLAGEDLKPVR